MAGCRSDRHLVSKVLIAGGGVNYDSLRGKSRPRAGMEGSRPLVDIF